MKKLILLLSLSLVSCSSLDQQYIEADRELYNIVAPRYLNYIDMDVNLDEEMKELQKGLIAGWDLRIRKAGEETK